MTTFKMALLSAVLLLTSFSYGQSALIEDATNTANLTMNECGSADTMTIIYRGVGDSITAVQLIDSMPSYFRVTGYIPSSNIISVDLSNPQLVTFSLADVGFTQNDTIRMLVAAECDANVGQSEYRHYMTLSATQNGGTMTAIDSSANFISGTKAPVLQLNPVGITNTSDALPGVVYCRSWKAFNTGVGSTLDSFTFQSILEPGIQLSSLTVNGVMVTPVISGDTIRYGISQDLGVVSSFPGDTILFEECFTLDGCTNSATSSRVSAYWGCYSTSICKETVQNPNVTTDNQTPVVSRSFTMKRTLCFGQEADTAIITYTNSGGIATNILTHLASSTNGMTNYSGSRKGFLDTATLTIQVDGGAVSSYSPSNWVTTTKNRVEWPAGHKSDAVFWVLDTLKPGQTVVFKIAYHSPCMASSNQGRGSFASNCGISMNSYLNALTTYDDVCGVNSYSIARTQRSQYLHSNGSTFGPTDLDDGDTGTYYLEMTRFQMTGMPSSAAQGGYYELCIKFPTKLIWDGDTAGLIMDRTAGADANADSVYYDATNGLMKVFFPLNYWPSQGTTFPIKYYLDCSAPGPNGPQTVSYQLKRVNSGSCGDTCVIPITCESSVVTNLHCPGICPRGGISPEKYTISRITLGQPDNDDNGLADASGSLDSNVVRFDRALPGDTLLGVMKGVVVYGAQSPTAFTYGYASSEIDASGNLYESVGADIEIYDKSTGTNYFISDLPETVTTSGVSRKWGWDYSVSALSAMAGSTMPSTFVYEAGDSIVIKSKYLFAHHLGGSIIPNIVTNEFYVSDYANPTNDTAQYRCDEYSGAFTSIGYYITASQPGEYTVNSCNQTVLSFRMYHSVGVCCTYAGDNWFPGEYRPRLNVDSFYLETPEGYTLDSVNFYFRHTNGRGGSRYYYEYGASPVATYPAVYNGTTRYVYDLASYYDVNGGNVPISDEGFIEYARVYLSPSCAVGDGFSKVHTGWNFDKQFYESNYTVAYNNIQEEITYNKPDLEASNVGAITQTVGEPGVDWTFRVKNNSNLSDAENVWVSFASNGGISVDSVINVSTGMIVSPTSGIYQLGNLIKSSAGQDFRVYASYVSCELDSLKVYTGWDCSGYPASTSSISCKADSVYLILDPISPQLQTNFMSVPPRNPAGTAALVNLCDTLEYVVSVSQRKEAVANTLYFDIRKQTGLTIVPDSVFVSYPVGAPEKQVSLTAISSRIDRIDLGAEFAELDTFGLDKFSESPNNEYTVRVKMLTGCNFRSGRSVRFSARGKSPCGKTLSTVHEYDRIRINGAPAAKLHTTEVKVNVDTFNSCSATDSVVLVMDNNELSVTDSSTTYSLLLPYGLNYISGSEQFLSSSTFTGVAPTVSMDGNQQRLTWVADAIPANDSAVWSIDFNVTDSLGMCGISDFEVETASEFSASCGGTSCSSSIVNHSATSSIEIDRPEISISSSTVSIVHDTLTGTNDSLTINVNFANSGFKDANMQINVYEDANNDGIINAGDVNLFTSSKSFTTAGSSFDSILVASNGTFACPVLVEVVPTCDCASEQIVSSTSCNVIAVPVEFTFFKVDKLNNQDALLSWQTALEINNDRFEIERKLAGSPYFTKVGEVSGAGTSHQMNDYTFLDDISKLNGVICYRIKQVDYDNAHEYTNVACIDKSDVTEIVIYPNPSQGDVSIKLPESEQPYTVKLLDVSGRQLLEQEMAVSGTLNLTAISTGMYILNVSQEGQQVKTERIIIQK